MTKLACNYAIARFQPYAETGEFVNIGLVLACHEAKYFGYRLARRRRRITDFFRELEPNLYRIGLRLLDEELEAVSGVFATGKGADADRRASFSAAAFASLVRPRESLFRFGGARTVMAEKPEAELERLFEYFVDRQFAREKEYQETLMANHLRQVFGRAELMRLYRIDQVGNDQYSVSLPFVYREGERVIKAVKPLDLDKENSTKVYEHGDQWVARVRRLREMGEQPDDLLFTVRTPREGRRRMEAGREIVRELERLETKVVAFSDEDAVLQFARVSSPAAASN